MELYKTANKEILFVVEALHNTSKVEDPRKGGNSERSWNKIVFVMVQTDQAKKAIRTCKYFMDTPTAKVIFSDMFVRTVSPWKEYKKFGGMERGYKLEASNEGVSMSIFNRSLGDSGKGDTLFFRLDWFRARCLACEILDHVRGWETARAIGERLAAPSSHSSHSLSDMPAPVAPTSPVPDWWNQGSDFGQEDCPDF